MKFAFLFPAKIVFAERNLTHVEFEHEGMKFFEFEGRNIFFSTTEEKIKAEKNERNSYFVLVGDSAMYVAMGETRETFLDKITRNVEAAQQWVNNTKQKLDNPGLYEKEQAEIRAKIKAEREAADKEQEERNKRREEAAEVAFQKSLEDFKAGSKISYTHFERWCEHFNIKFPIKTKGWARKYITYVRKGSVDGHGFEKIPQGFMVVYGEFLKMVQK